MSYTVDDLRYLMERLRDPASGCQWDLRQEFSTIAPSTIEEAYELVDAIVRKDYADVKEECGDVLFQVIYYAELSKSLQPDDRFTFSEIVHSLVEKLIRRHPHVFPEGKLYRRRAGDDISASEQAKNWEAYKAQEREKKGLAGFFDDIPVGLPASIRAKKIQKRAANVGFDWEGPEGVLIKLEEEVTELRQAMAAYRLSANADSRNSVKEEFGDVIFTLVNLARHLKMDFDMMAKAANEKFVRRFTAMLDLVKENGLAIDTLKVSDLESLWVQVKRDEGEGGTSQLS